MPRRVSRDNPVRKCLFPVQDNEARSDNLVNHLQDMNAAELAQKTARWNFDFKNERPLEGAYEWHKGDGFPYDWIGNTKVLETEDQSDLKNENETTPKGHKDEIIPLLRKRKTDVENRNVSEVKRKIIL